MDSLKDILSHKDIEEPTEVSALREFVKQEYNIDPTIKVAANLITLYMPNASMSSLLRMRYHEIQRRCQLTRKLYIRIG